MTKRLEERKAQSGEFRKPLCKAKILVCGKEGNRKSSIVALRADALHKKGTKCLL